MERDDHRGALGDTRRRPAARGAKIAGGTALALGLGAGGYAVAGAVSTPGSRPATATATAASSSTPAPEAPWAGARHPGGPFGIRGWRESGLSGLVSAVGTSSITLQTPAGSTVTVQVTSSTTYSQDGKSLTLASLAPGQDVVVRPTSASATSSSPVAAAVAVVGPTLSGRVVSVTGSTIVLADAQGFYRNVVTSSSTTVTEAGSASSLSAVTAGTWIEAVGTVAADRSDLDASAIRVVLPVVAGEVTAVDTHSGTITIQPLGPSDASSGSPGAPSVQVTTTSSTRFVDGTSSATLGSIAIGDLVVASGTPGSNSTFAALEVRVLPKAVGVGGPVRHGGSWQMPAGFGMLTPGAGGSGPAAA